MNFYSKHEANLQKLVTQFPDLFCTKQNLGFAWPNGWHHLVLEACEQVAAKAPDLRWVQIKEKFAGLRLYFVDGPMYMDNVASMTTAARIDGSSPDTAIAQPIIDAICQRSMATCMGCGNPGTRKIRTRVIYTACDACFGPS